MPPEEPSNDRDLVGTLVARSYRVESALGKDARRMLYGATHVESSSEVILAVVRADSSSAARLRGVEKLRTLEHPGLLRVIDSGTLESGELYMATERPEGASVRELAGGKPLAQRQALGLMRQVLDAVSAVHAIGEVHGDITPDRIFMKRASGGAEERVVVAGLGIATLAGGRGAGDPLYSVPEATLGPLDARADLYAVGAVLFELLTGRPPFFADDAAALRRLHAYAPVQTLKQRAPKQSFSDELEHVVAASLAKKRDTRFTTAAAMIEALDRAIEALPPVPPVPTTASPPSPPASANDSLLLYARDLMPESAPPERPSSLPIVPDNVGRVVPVLPWHTRVGVSVRRTLDRISVKLRLPRWLVGTLATALAGALLLVVMMCAVGTEENKRTPIAEQPGATAETQPTPAVPAEATPTTSSAPVPTVSLEKRCEQLGKSCTDTPKRVAKLVADCRELAKKQTEKRCAAAASAAYDCYERRLCGRAEKIWALDDFRVLAERQKTCVAEARAARACVGPP